MARRRDVKSDATVAMLKFGVEVDTTSAKFFVAKVAL
jgi:hypothetical protein